MVLGETIKSRLRGIWDAINNLYGRWHWDCWKERLKGLKVLVMCSS